MNQTKRKSLEEALLNTAVGFLIGVTLNLFILPVMLNIPTDTMSMELAVQISILYGGTSIIRSFILRRLYNNNRVRWRI